MGRVVIRINSTLEVIIVYSVRCMVNLGVLRQREYILGHLRSKGVGDSVTASISTPSTQNSAVSVLEHISIGCTLNKIEFWRVCDFFSLRNNSPLYGSPPKWKQEFA